MQLDLILPGLFDRLGEWAQSYAPLPEFPQLQSMLARARVDRAAPRGLEASIWRHFDPLWSAPEPLPAAPLIGTDATANVLHATPVHLEVGMRDLILSRPEPLDADERRELAETIDEQLQNAGQRFIVDAFGNGYLSLDETLEIVTTPPSLVAGEGIRDHLPKGTDAATLHRLMTELQMVLHAAPFNRRREQRGLKTVNALWLWGGGNADRTLRAAHDLLLSDNPFATACAAATGQQFAAPPARFETGHVDGAERVLVVDDRLLPAVQNDDIHRWQVALATFERDWLAPMRDAIRSGRLERVTIDPCHGRVFSLSRADRWKIWRRPRPLVELS